MVYTLGLDTGGTFTDAAIIDNETGALLAKTKAPTTRHNLSIGLGHAISDTVNLIPQKDRSKINKICLSTTLATNAVVEGVGGRVGLVMIGFSSNALERNNLGAVLGDSPVVFVDGGHHPDGRPQTPLDISALDDFAKKHVKNINAIAIAGHFATRNPEHEIAARDHLRAITKLPVTCSYELSSSLGGPKRALTALLNARLIDILDQQITATDAIIKKTGLNAEQMVVKGDGSLVSAQFARIRPVETILSGPAASISGAYHLVGCKDAIVADIGGTTTDITILEDGFPRLSPRGATIGGWSTMVVAADIRTSGLGGDSEVRLIDRGTKGGVIIGPRRVVSLASIGAENPAVITWLNEQLLNPVASGLDARFVIPLFSGPPPDWLTRSEATMARQCQEKGIQPVAAVAETRLALSAIDRLIARGLLTLAAFTPTDAALVLDKACFSPEGGHKGKRGKGHEKGHEGGNRGMDATASRLGAQLLARQRTGGGVAQAESITQFAHMVLDCLTVKTSLALLESAFAHQGAGEATASKNAILEVLIEKSVANKDTTDSDDLVAGTIKLKKPLIALGASAACHYPAVAEVLDTALIVPEDADVAGAIGAAIGSIRQYASIIITSPGASVFRVHAIAGFRDFDSLDDAIDFAETCAKDEARKKAEAAGAQNIMLTANRQIKSVPISDNETLFLEASIHGLATSQAS